MDNPKRNQSPSPRLGRMLVALAFVAILLAACRPAEPATPTVVPTPTGPQVRVTNAGQTDIDNLIMIFPDERIVIGDVPAGATSEYVPAPKGVYGYAAYQVMVNGQAFEQPVIDWVGESPMPGEAFTYVLDVDPTREGFMVVQAVEVKTDR